MGIAIAFTRWHIILRFPVNMSGWAKFKEPLAWAVCVFDKKANLVYFGFRVEGTLIVEVIHLAKIKGKLSVAL